MTLFQAAREQAAQHFEAWVPLHRQELPPLQARALVAQALLLPCFCSRHAHGAQLRGEVTEAQDAARASAARAEAADAAGAAAREQLGRAEALAAAQAAELAELRARCLEPKT